MTAARIMTLPGVRRLCKIVIVRVKGETTMAEISYPITEIEGLAVLHFVRTFKDRMTTINVPAAIVLHDRIE